MLSNALQGQLYDQREQFLSSSDENIYCNAESKQIHLGRMEEQLQDSRCNWEYNRREMKYVDRLFKRYVSMNRRSTHRRMCSKKEALNGIVDQLIAEESNFKQLVSLVQNATRTLSHPKPSHSVTETNILNRNVAE